MVGVGAMVGVGVGVSLGGIGVGVSVFDGWTDGALHASAAASSTINANLKRSCMVKRYPSKGGFEPRAQASPHSSALICHSRARRAGSSASREWLAIFFEMKYSPVTVATSGEVAR